MSDPLMFLCVQDSLLLCHVPAPPEAKLTEGVSIDDYSTWRAVRFADQDEIG